MEVLTDAIGRHQRLVSIRRHVGEDVRRGPTFETDAQLLAFRVVADGGDHGRIDRLVVHYFNSHGGNSGSPSGCARTASTNWPRAISTALRRSSGFSGSVSVTRARHPPT